MSITAETAAQASIVDDFATAPHSTLSAFSTLEEQ